MNENNSEAIAQVPARWTDDCQGKKDFDGELVRLSSRYWPRGGGFHTFSRQEGWQGNETRPEIKPSAKASILLYFGPTEEECEYDYETLIAQDFEADTEAEVKAQVEAWAQAQYDKIAATLRSAFASDE